MTADNPRKNDFLPHFLPHYTYVPGLTVHPALGVGHASEMPAPARFLQTGIWLFDHGYYWEAHEAWEHDWIALGRTGHEANFVKALIKLAASGVKSLALNQVGAVRHAARAVQLLKSVAAVPRQERGGAIPESACLVALQEFAEQMVLSPALPTDMQRQAALQGGVPLLGQLPLLAFLEPT